MSKLLKAALILGIAPLVIGITIFVSWVLSWAEWLPIAGRYTIYVGIGAVVGLGITHCGPWPTT